MPLVVVNTAKVSLLQNLVAPFNTFTLRLFVNNHTPASPDTASNYTEASFPGYAAIAVNAWGNAAFNASSQGQTTETVRTFTQTSVPGSPQTVYGYYITDAGGNLQWAEANPFGGQLMNAAPQTYQVLPLFVDDNL
jgi:hypothetical protein